MPPGPPIRLSAALALHAREAAAVQDRSLTEQVEHWARLGQVVEQTVLATTVEKLKAISYDAQLPKLLASADTLAGRRKAAKLVRERNVVRYGIEGDELVTKRRRKR